MTTILLIAAVVFVAYAGIVHLDNTDAGQPFVKRMWAAVMAAGASLGALVMSWFSN